VCALARGSSDLGDAKFDKLHEWAEGQHRHMWLDKASSVKSSQVVAYGSTRPSCAAGRSSQVKSSRRIWLNEAILRCRPFKSSQVKSTRPSRDASRCRRLARSLRRRRFNLACAGVHQPAGLTRLHTRASTSWL